MPEQTKQYMVLVRHVEQSEGKKFKKIPKLQYAPRVGPYNARNYTNYSVTTNKKGEKRMGPIKSADIKVSNKFAREYTRPRVASTICHELRENLRVQHGNTVVTKGKSLKLADRKLHRSVARFREQDYRFAKRRIGEYPQDRASKLKRRDR